MKRDVYTTEFHRSSDFRCPALPTVSEVDKSQRLSARISQRSNLIIMPLVFTSFVIGMLSEYDQDLALYGTFSVLNGFVGGAIFFFHCTGNQQVRPPA